MTDGSVAPPVTFAMTASAPIHIHHWVSPALSTTPARVGPPPAAYVTSAATSATPPAMHTEMATACSLCGSSLPSRQFSVACSGCSAPATIAAQKNTALRYHGTSPSPAAAPSSKSSTASTPPAADTNAPTSA